MVKMSLERIALFRNASASAKKRLMDGAVREQYHRGNRLFRQGEEARFIWFVLDGWIHLIRGEKRPGASNAVALFTVTPSDVLCGVSGLSPGTYTATAVAGGDVEVLRIPTELMQKLLKDEPAMAYETLKLCAERLRHMAEHCGKMTQPVQQRIGHTILRLHDQFGDRIPITHRELAQLAWTTTESAIRSVRQLKREGFLEGERGVLKMKRPQALRQGLAVSQSHGEVSNGHSNRRVFNSP